MKYIRSLAEKTDIGRLTAPSLLKLAYESANLNDGGPSDGKTSTEIWNDIEQILEVFPYNVLFQPFVLSYKAKHSLWLLLFVCRKLQFLLLTLQSLDVTL